jgi:hypothetical protein
MTAKRSPGRGKPRAGSRRKDRLIQARVDDDLASTLEREAQRRRLTVSHLIRNILEDTFQLVDDVVANVDDIVNDSVQLARRVGRDARRVADAVREVVAEPVPGDDEESAHALDEAEADAVQDASAPEDPLESIYAWNAVILHRAAHCSRCAARVERGSEAFVGLSDEPNAPRAWLCAACREAL